MRLAIEVLVAPAISNIVSIYMDWTSLTSLDQIQGIDRLPSNKIALIFKHSTSCSISHIARKRLLIFSEKEDMNQVGLEIYYLDLLAHRNISNYIAHHYSVHHESPQVLLIRNGECFYDSSHLDITSEELSEQIFSVAPASI